MDAPTEQRPTLWSNTQAYVMAIICLVVGLGIGYMLHPKKPAAPKAPPPQAAGPAALDANTVTPDRLRHMADKAAEPFLAQLQQEPNNAELLAKIASVYFRGQQFPLAVEYYDRAMKVQPSAEGFVSLSNAYHYAGSDDLAFQTLQRALELDPKSANALFNLGMLTWQVKNDPKGAIEFWQRILKHNPKHPRRAQVEGMIANARKHLNNPAAKKPM